MEEYYRLTLNETQWAILVNSPTGKMGGMEAGGRSQNGACLADIYGRLSCSLKKAVFAPATVPGADCHRRSAKPDVPCSL